jgi:hypothetical protein
VNIYDLERRPFYPQFATTSRTPYTSHETTSHTGPYILLRPIQKMASPVHRFLFSPPTSPNLSAAASPLLDDPVGTIRELLSPSVPQGGFVNYKPSAIAAEAEVTTSSMGPGGFNSTRSYPSRYTRASSSRSANVNAYELPPIPASVKTAMPLDVPSTTSRNDSSRGQRLHRRTNSVTNDVLRLEIAQTAGLNVSSRPILSRSALKRLALFFAVLASIYLFASSSLIGGKRLSVMNNGTMTPEAIRQELVGSPAIRPSSRYVGGKKITVKSSHGAPKVIVTQKMSAAQGQFLLLSREPQDYSAEFSFTKQLHLEHTDLFPLPRLSRLNENFSPSRLTFWKTRCIPSPLLSTRASLWIRSSCSGSLLGMRTVGKSSRGRPTRLLFGISGMREFQLF